MSVKSFFIEVIKGLFAFYLLITTFCGFTTLSIYACFSLKYAAVPFLGIFIVIGFYFATASATTLCQQSTQPLSRYGYELYHHQRGITLLICSSVILTWPVHNLLLSYNIDSFLLDWLIASYLSLLQIRVAQFLSNGRLFSLVTSPLEQEWQNNYSLQHFVTERLFCYAEKKYLNAQISFVIFLLVLSVQLIAQTAYEQQPLLINLYNLLRIWAVYSQIFIACGILIPSAYYIWCCAPFCINFRKYLNWLAPSILNMLQCLGAFFWGYEQWMQHHLSITQWSSNNNVLIIALIIFWAYQSRSMFKPHWSA
jgi:hypothetical protein